VKRVRVAAPGQTLVRLRSAGLQVATAASLQQNLSPPMLTSLNPATPQALPDAPDVLDVIFIEGLVGRTVIGIHAQELHETQPLVIDLYAGVPRARACDTDRIHDTIDYSVVRERLHRLLAEHRVQLLEAFAEAVADILIGEFGASWVRVKVVKPRKFDDVAAVGVQIERRASERDNSSAQPHGAAVLRLIGGGMVPGRG
jgi:7,8-dihydroneopterin aldolase/epimerase/oxygenase